ncbi:hypothetical protein BLNAU_22551 [Blattamonas nauphoetae]|uniref:Uncharacterized protein n=1 Tax=Blattamonas nauphoetae TaxID=2049346 RepID=A0ABQ9WT78_9EUKA|nr:hypothetical protein BLNAU_22551 [Blattamonas nauphoetae]
MRRGAILGISPTRELTMAFALTISSSACWISLASGNRHFRRQLGRIGRYRRRIHGRSRSLLLRIPHPPSPLILAPLHTPCHACRLLFVRNTRNARFDYLPPSLSLTRPRVLHTSLLSSFVTEPNCVSEQNIGRGRVHLHPSPLSPPRTHRHPQLSSSYEEYRRTPRLNTNIQDLLKASSFMIAEHTLAGSTTRGLLRKGHSCRVVEGRNGRDPQNNNADPLPFLTSAFDSPFMLLVLIQLATSKHAFADSLEDNSVSFLKQISLFFSDDLIVLIFGVVRSSHCESSADRGASVLFIWHVIYSCGWNTRFKFVNGDSGCDNKGDRRELGGGVTFSNNTKMEIGVGADSFVETTPVSLQLDQSLSITGNDEQSTKLTTPVNFITVDLKSSVTLCNLVVHPKGRLLACSVGVVSQFQSFFRPITRIESDKLPQMTEIGLKTAVSSSPAHSELSSPSVPSSMDTSPFLNWKEEQMKTVDELAVVFRALTFKHVDQIVRYNLTTKFDAQQLSSKVGNECTNVVENIATSFRLSTPEIVIPSEQYIWHLCVNRFSIVEGSQSKFFMRLFAQLLHICSYCQPTVDFVVNMPVFLTITSCLTFFEDDNSIYSYLNYMNGLQQERNKKGGKVQQMWTTVQRLLRMEGIEDVVEAKLRNDKQGNRRWIVAKSIEWNNQLGMNLPEQELIQTGTCEDSNRSSPFALHTQPSPTPLPRFSRF